MFLNVSPNSLPSWFSFISSVWHSEEIQYAGGEWQKQRLCAVKSSEHLWPSAPSFHPLGGDPHSWGGGGLGRGHAMCHFMLRGHFSVFSSLWPPPGGGEMETCQVLPPRGQRGDLEPILGWKDDPVPGGRGRMVGREDGPWGWKLRTVGKWEARLGNDQWTKVLSEFEICYLRTWISKMWFGALEPRKASALSSSRPLHGMLLISGLHSLWYWICNIFFYLLIQIWYFSN